ncbi:MAG: lactonase family protein [Gemmatimonadaceae bacterium]
MLRRNAHVAAAALMLAACSDATRPTAPAPDSDLSTSAGSAEQALRLGRAGAVYVLTNAATGNDVAVFRRAADGTLTAAGRFATGGEGTGAGLGSQNAVVLSHGGRLLFAVNAGSNEVSAFIVLLGRLLLVSTVPSGGTQPVSLTVHDNLLYVLNAGGAGNITGFRIGFLGTLTPIAESTRDLSGDATAPAQIEFSPNGRLLVVTERATNLILTYAVNRRGLPGEAVAHPSAGMTPFGFAFGRRGELIVSEAFGGAPDQSAASSYTVGRDGELEVVSASVPTTETAACWFVVTDNGRFAYTTNTGSGSISAYLVGRDGSLTLRDEDGRTAMTGGGSTPIDVAVSRNSRFLYALAGGNGTVAAFRIESDGGLTPIAGGSGLPAGAVGLAAE